MSDFGVPSSEMTRKIQIVDKAYFKRAVMERYGKERYGKKIILKWKGKKPKLKYKEKLFNSFPNFFTNFLKQYQKFYFK